MFGVTIRGHAMIAHSLRGEHFGAARNLHGATLVVDATFRGEALGGDGVLVDIARATVELDEVLAELDYRNLDDEPAFEGVNTTTEVLARYVADRLACRVREGALGQPDAVCGLVVTIHESPLAWASFERAP